MTFTWRQQWRFIAWMSVYVVVVLITSMIISPGLPLGAKIALAIAPMIPALFALFACMAAFRELDELQRQITAESILASFCITAVLTFGYGFLQAYAGAPNLNWFFVWPVMAVSWGVAKVFTVRRYR